MKYRYILIGFAAMLFISGCGKKNEPVVEPVPPPVPDALELTWDAELPTTKCSGAVSFVLNGRAYLAFGRNDNNQYLGTVRMYNPNTDTWHAMSDVPVFFQKSSSATSFTVGDRAYVLGGYDGNNVLKTFYSYEPFLDQWTQEALPPLAFTPRAGMTSFVIDKTAYIVGGYDQNGLFDEVWSYDTELKTWTQLNNFGGGLRYNAVSFIIDGEVYVGSGTGSANVFDVREDVWKYNPDADTWAQTASMPIDKERSGAVSFVLDGKAYVTTGLGANVFDGYLKDLLIYDPVAGSWEVEEMPEAFLGRYLATSFVIDDEAFICTGLSSNDGRLGDLWRGSFQ